MMAKKHQEGTQPKVEEEKKEAEVQPVEEPEVVSEVPAGPWR